MRAVTFILQYSGQATPESGDSSKMTVSASAPSQALETSIDSSGVAGSRTEMAGGTAQFESNVQADERGQFHEQGTITYGEAGSITFDTLGRGAMFPIGDDGSAYGSVIWRVVAGTGAFEGASGTITSNFRVSGSGEVTDTQVANLNLGD